jgi:hypothetical protein
LRSLAEGIPSGAVRFFWQGFRPGLQFQPTDFFRIFLKTIAAKKILCYIQSTNLRQSFQERRG